MDIAWLQIFVVYVPIDKCIFHGPAKANTVIYAM